jgi:hypothetical protein
MATSKLDLLYLYTDTVLKVSSVKRVCGGDEDFRSPDESYFSPPGQELVLPSSTLLDLLNGSPTLMSSLAKLYAAEEDKVSEKAILEIESFIVDPAVDLDMKEHRTRRLLDYVYPVV